MRQLTLNETFLAVLVGLVALSIAVTVLGSWLSRRAVSIMSRISFFVVSPPSLGTRVSSAPSASM